VSARPASRRRYAPVWLMGLSNAVFGLYAGIVVISVPQLLSARRVPETTIAAMTAVMVSPGFWSFLVSPVLDVRFSRRWYSTVTALAAAVLLVLALLNLGNLALVEALITIGFFFANLYQSALGGWLSSITTTATENKLSTWVTIGNIGGGGAMAVLTGVLMRNLSPILAAILVGVAVLLPTAVFPWMRAPAADRRLASESFPQFFREVMALLRQREVLIAIVLFISPTATFSLTNFLTGIGRDFNASSGFVGWIGGVGVLAGGIAGCLSFQLFDRLLPTRLLYLAIAVVGSLFTLALLLLPRTPATFAVALTGENVFQAIAITVMVAIAFETIGRANPLAATTYSLMISAANIPITYMLLVDGWGYARHGLAGSLGVDAGLGLLSAVILAALLIRYAPARILAPKLRSS
jgi:MFS transporter, PAT family, beta-lactamase induction signal transducer AmpG